MCVRVARGCDIPQFLSAAVLLCADHVCGGRVCGSAAHAGADGGCRRRKEAGEHTANQGTQRNNATTQRCRLVGLCDIPGFLSAFADLQHTPVLMMGVVASSVGSV